MKLQKDKETHVYDTRHFVYTPRLSESLRLPMEASSPRFYGRLPLGKHDSKFSYLYLELALFSIHDLFSGSRRSY